MEVSRWGGSLYIIFCYDFYVILIYSHNILFYNGFSYPLPLDPFGNSHELDV